MILEHNDDDEMRAVARKREREREKHMRKISRMMIRRWHCGQITTEEAKQVHEENRHWSRMPLR